MSASLARDTGEERTRAIDMIVLHSIGGPVCAAGEVKFDPINQDATFWKDYLEKQSVAGIHYVVGRNGVVETSIPESQVANHSLRPQANPGQRRCPIKSSVPPAGQLDSGSGLAVSLTRARLEGTSQKTLRVNGYRVPDTQTPWTCRQPRFDLDTLLNLYENARFTSNRSCRFNMW